MHLYFITRGKRNFVRRFIENLEGIFLPFNKKYMLQLVPRPVQLWELAFPEEHKEKVFKMIGDDGFTKVGKEGEHKGRINWIKNLTNKLIKMIGLEKIPMTVNDDKKTRINRDNVGVHLIGTKKDWFKEGIEQI